MKVTTTNLEETYKLAQEFIDKASLLPRQSGAFVVLLEGDLGSGKTSFAQGMATALGVTEHVTSPTFVILKAYELGDVGGRYKRLVHIDAYRLESKHDLELIGFDELSKNPENLILIEWPEKVGLAEGHKIKFSFVDETAHQIEIPTS